MSNNQFIVSRSQPSLSQALAALENGLGVQLIERSTRRVIVTPVGSSLLPFAQATVDSLDAFVSHAKGAQGHLSGQVSIGMIPTTAPFILPTLLRSLPEVAPEMEPRIVEEKTASLVDSLRQGGMDAAVLASPEDGSGLSHIDLYHEEFVLVVPSTHSYAGRTDLTVDDLHGLADADGSNGSDELDLLLLDDGHCLTRCWTCAVRRPWRRSRPVRSPGLHRCRRSCSASSVVWAARWSR